VIPFHDKLILFAASQAARPIASSSLSRGPQSQSHVQNSGRRHSTVSLPWYLKVQIESHAAHCASVSQKERQGSRLGGGDIEARACVCTRARCSSCCLPAALFDLVTRRSRSKSSQADVGWRWLVAGLAATVDRVQKARRGKARQRVTVNVPKQLLVQFSPVQISSPQSDAESRRHND